MPRDDEYAAATAPESRLILHPNRHVTVVMEDGTSYHLKPPDIEQWQQIVAAYTAANTRYGDKENPHSALRRLFGWPAMDDDPGEEALAAEAFALVVKLCSTPTTELPTARLPIWAGEISVFTDLYEHWRKVRITVENAVEEDASVPPTGYGPVSDAAAPAEQRDGIPVFDMAAAMAMEPPAVGSTGGIPAAHRPGGATLQTTG